MREVVVAVSEDKPPVGDGLGVDCYFLVEEKREVSHLNQGGQLETKELSVNHGQKHTANVAPQNKVS